ncbi:MAG: dihydroorotase [Pseudomonadota bacterium]
MKVHIRGGRILDPSLGVDQRADLWIEDGRVLAILGPKDSPPSRPDRLLDASGAVVSPGFVDLHTHLREPGQTEQEDIGSATKAAVAGGFTSVLAMPNTDPVNDSAEVTRFILERARLTARCKVFPVGAVSKGLRGEALSPMRELKEAGCKAFSDDGRPINDAHFLRQALLSVAALDSVLMEHCEEAELSRGPTIHPDPVAESLGLAGIPRSAETVDVARTLALAAETGARTHLCHISCAASVELIRAFKPLGRVTAEVAPHHLLLTVDAIRDCGTNAKMYPPLRSDEDRHALRLGLADGTLDAVATDHAPHTREEKSRCFPDAPNGIIGLETALPVLLTLVHDGAISLNRLVECLTVRPARIAGLESGTLAPGSPADVVIFTPDEPHVIQEEDFFSKSRNTPFLGFRGRGRVVATLVNGLQVYPKDER